MMTTALPWTGERYVPGVCPEESTELQHLARYRWAQGFTKKRHVLDVGCGCGYGTAILADGAASAVGFDCDHDSIQYAQERYQAGGIGFAIGNAEECVFPTHRFDVAVCFELLEHLDDPDACLVAMWSMLRENGLLIASTPNLDKPEPDAVFHKHAWRSLAFADLIEQAGCFRVIAIFGQHVDDAWELNVQRWDDGAYTTIVAVA